MIVKEVKGSEGKAYFLIPQDADDLFSIRRILSRDDQIEVNELVSKYGSELKVWDSTRWLIDSE
jgi:stalled ribosome rescue protein Dom34